MRLIDADALIRDLQERYCRPCKAAGLDYNEARCRACQFDDELDDIDGFADNSVELKQIKYFDEEEKVWKIGSVIVDGEREGE